MRSTVKKSMIFFVLGVLIPASLPAQNLQNIFAEFRKLQRYVLRVDELVQHFNDARAAGLMIDAKNELEEARSLLFNNTPPKYLRARNHMISAKQKTDLAAKIVLSKPYGNLKAQLDELINKAEQLVSGSQNDEARYLLFQALKFKRNAIDAFTRGQITRGQEYYRIAFFFGRKCISLMTEDKHGIDAQIEDLIGNVRQLLAEAETLPEEKGNENLAKIIDNAQENFEEAQRLVETGKKELALKRLLLLQRLLYRLFDQAENSNISEQSRLENSLFSQKAFLESLDSRQQEDKDEAVQPVLKKSWELYWQANKHFENNEYVKAQAEIGLSQRLANKAFQMSRRTSDDQNSDMQARLQETRNLLNIQETRINAIRNNEAAMQIYKEAVKILNRAENLLEGGKNQQAFLLIQTATRMSSRIQKLISSEEKISANDIQKIQGNYQHLVSLLDKLEANQDLHKTHNDIIASWRNFSDQAKKCLESGNIQLADEYINTTLEQIKFATDKWRK